MGFWLSPTCDNIQLYTISRIAAERLDAGVQFDIANDEINYYDSDGNWTKLDDYSVMVVETAFHRVKFCIDLENKVYMRCLANNRAFAMTQAIREAAVANAGGYTIVQIQVTSRAGQNDVGYIDYVILTGEEPT